ncbi:hypothetical protein [Lentimicrobium sp. S6]|uniref:hypothetical protein n=1 Tax=Lentimicrobium sp. S6 TaxID=2735872 RepID=UPI0015544614|nr:hypothetical protein [Lentimicrobium sp. S6]NPD47471.1 hypothetical protein [Lentimicrobium sp. S6]
MKLIIKFTSIILIVISIAGCSKEKRILDLETYLKSRCDYVHQINGFYIVSSNQKPNAMGTTSGTTAKEVFEHSVRLFSNFLDQNEDGIIDTELLELSNGLSENMIFVSGHLRFVDKVSFAKSVEDNNLYAMSMQTNNWEYIKNYNGKGWKLNSLNSSTWRPDIFNALWEETFHTITEAFSRFDNDFKFTKGSSLRNFMEADITAGTYDISVQNQEENGDYDKVTAVNEYIHQIWAIQFSGQEDKLNIHQKNALDFMINKKVPMTLNLNYNKTLGTRIKG